MMPIRQKQHDLIDQLTHDVAELVTELSAVNTAVQQEDGSAEGRQAAAEVERYAERMTTPVVIDAELRRRLGILKSATITREALTDSLVENIRRFAGLMERLRVARESQQIPELERLSVERGRDQEPLRSRNHEALLAAKSVRQRLQDLQRRGLGELSDGWWARRSWRIRSIRNS
jgi:hypothetical protein